MAKPIWRKTELLAPAGSFDSARAAVNAGADAIYMGGPFFSARAFAESSAEGAEKHGSDAVEEDMLMQAIEFCHLRGVRVFMTLNTLLKEKEIATLKSYLQPYVDKHLDGVIVQDLGVFRMVREMFPALELHVSTQAAITGWRTAKRYLEMGAKRIVLARELSLDEIREIKEKTGAELEVFAHGALCYSYSGDCLMSSFIGGRSGNRGKCAGTCRLPFDVYEPGAEHERRHLSADCSKTGISGLKKINKTNEQYLLSMCDLNTLDRLCEMIRAGVYSFKIEGRMKSPLYTAAVTSIYRKYLDMAEAVMEKGGDTYKIASADKQLLSEVFDRSGTTSGYLDGLNGREMLTLLAKPDFRNRNEEIVEEIQKKYLDNDIKVGVAGCVRLHVGEKPEFTLSLTSTDKGKDIFRMHDSDRAAVTVIGEAPVDAASKRPISREDVIEKISKFGGTDFELVELTVEMDDNCFMPIKAINELRRKAVEELRAKLIG